nr:MAG TPA: hypothetical protein [Caudoviricetes sp.]
MKRTKHLSARGAKRQFHLLAVFSENILIRVDTVNIWLGFGTGGLTMKIDFYPADQSVIPTRLRLK